MKKLFLIISIVSAIVLQANAQARVVVKTPAKRVVVVRRPVVVAPVAKVVVVKPSAVVVARPIRRKVIIVHH